MLPIEEGCLAIVINSIDTGDDGKVVTVGKYLGGACPSMLQQDLWEVDLPMKVINYFTREVDREEYYQSESRLMRIDGEEFEEEEELMEVKL